MLNTKEILDRMEKVDGWFSRQNGSLLLKSCVEALGKTSSKNVVEIGSFKGRSTVVLGSVAKDTKSMVWAVDPHEGDLVGPHGHHAVAPTFEIFTETIKSTGLNEWVTPVRQRASEVKWDKPIAFLFIDGLHDYSNVSSDYKKFSPFVEQTGLLAFHDYSEQFKGVFKFVNEVLASGAFQKKEQEGSLVILRRGVGR